MAPRMACWGAGGYRAPPEGDGEIAQKGHETPGKEKLLSVLFTQRSASARDTWRDQILVLWHSIVLHAASLTAGWQEKHVIDYLRENET